MNILTNAISLGHSLYWWIWGLFHFTKPSSFLSFLLVSMLTIALSFICTCVYESFIHRQLIIYAQPTIEWCLQTDFATQVHHFV